MPAGNVVGLILAGGQGERLWPKSLPERPKQFLRLGGGDQSLLQATFKRLTQVLPPERIWVVTLAAYASQVRDQLPDLPPGNLILEPAPRGTAGAIGLACVMGQWEGTDTVQLVLPADHLVKDEQQFARTLQEASLVAQEGLLVTIGLEPTRPETAYGYVKLGQQLDGWPFPVYAVEGFREKPSLPVARRIYRDGRHLWNAGIFAWKVSVFLARLAQHLPQHARALQQVARTPPSAREDLLRMIYPSMPATSVDHGVMEKIREGLAVVPARFEWDDLGNWLAMERILPEDAHGNRCRGNALLQDCRGVLVDWEGRAAIIAGARNLIIAGSGDRLLVCTRRHCRRLANLVRAMDHLPAEQTTTDGGNRPCGC
ncbi:MAG: sugar phosphate nucleotidyltransferase [Bacillota bacterium]